MKKRTRYLRLLLIILNAVMVPSLGYLVLSSRQILERGTLLFLSSAILLTLILNIYLSTKVLSLREMNNMFCRSETSEDKLFDDTMLSLINEVRALQHDHLNTLDGVFNVKNCNAAQDIYQEIVSYISSLNSMIGEFDNILQINNRAIGALLYFRSCQAKANNVDFYQDIPPYQVDIPLQNDEYFAALNLLLANAFASVQDQGVPKEIIFRLDHERGKPFFEVVNNGKQQVYLPHSLKDIRKIVWRYQGRIVVLPQGTGVAYRIQFG